jgi:hypothetical protein
VLLELLRDIARGPAPVNEALDYFAFVFGELFEFFG